MRPTWLVLALVTLALVCCDSAQAQRLGRSGGYGFNRPTGGYGFVRGNGGYGFNRPTGGFYGGYYPYVYPYNYGYYGYGYAANYSYGNNGMSGIWANNAFSFPGLNMSPSTGPKVYESLVPKPASKDGQFTLPGSRTTLSFPTIKTSRNRSQPRTDKSSETPRDKLRPTPPPPADRSGR